jgi:hypothetical protein
MTWTLGGSQVGNLTYAYDANGRVTVKGGSLAQINLPATAIGNTFNADNAMTAFNGTALTYDANGNLTSGGTNTDTSDARNHLMSVSCVASASVIYDAFWGRVEKTINGTTTQFLCDGLNPVQEPNAASPPVATANMLRGLNIDEYFQRSSSNGTFSYLTDMLRSTLALPGLSGALNAAGTYEPLALARRLSGRG